MKCRICGEKYSKERNETFHQKVCPDSLSEQLKRSDTAENKPMTKTIEDLRDEAAENGDYREGESCSFYMDEIEAFKQGWNACEPYARAQAIQDVIDSLKELDLSIYKSGEDLAWRLKEHFASELKHIP